MDRTTNHRPDIELDPVNFPEEVAAEVQAHLGGGGGAVWDHDHHHHGHEHAHGHDHGQESSKHHHLHEKPGETPDFGMSQSRGGWQI